MALEDKIKRIFEQNPKTDTFYSVSTGNVFSDKHKAEAFAQTLKGKEVKTHTRAEYEAKETETVAETETTAKEETVAEAPEGETAPAETPAAEATPAAPKKSTSK